jgi:uncharacterized protein YhfF
MTDLESFAFGDSPALADELLALVLAGKKTATCWAASEGGKGVEIGKRWIVKDGQGRARAVVETVELTRRRFKKVDAAFAFDEGEGDRSLGWWRRAHTNYFTRRGEFAPGMEVYCERFRLVEVIDAKLRRPVPSRYPSPALQEKAAGAGRRMRALFTPRRIPCAKCLGRRGGR